MARKHPVSPNQTALWTYHALAPEWGSPALVVPSQAQDDPIGMTGTKGRQLTESVTRTKVRVVKSSAGRSTSALICHRSVSDLDNPLPRRARRRRSVGHHTRKPARVEHLV